LHGFHCFFAERFKRGIFLQEGSGLKGVTSQVIAEVRSHAQILDLVSETVVLKRAGKHYKGLCPFHNEKTPSFIVNPDKGIYKCFGCGEGGDVFTFVQKVKGLEFLDSVRELAHRYGVPLVETHEEREQYDKRTQMLLLYQQASEYYCRLLKQESDGAAARQYLEERGISEEIIDRFKIGFASGAWDGLMQYLVQANTVAAASLDEAGLVRKRQDGSGHFDLFRQRLMIPICDDQGRVIAFGGRTLSGDQVKYLNSPETAIYSKGHNLFGFHLAKTAIKEKDSVLVVEGYFDTITAHQYGFTNTVATLGTALTSQQAKMLVRYTESRQVYLCFDADPAGLKAVDRGIETLNEVAQGVGIDLKVINVPGGKDPDECLRTSDGAQLFTTAMEQALPIIDHQLDLAWRQEDTQTHTGKIEAAKKIVPILAQIKNAVARGEYVRRSAIKLGVREEELISDVAQFRKDNRLATSSNGAPVRPQTHNQRGSAFVRGKGGLLDGMVRAEQSLLALFLTTRSNYDQAYSALEEEEFITPAHKRVKETIYAIGSHFNNLEDLEYKLRDRLAPEREPSAALLDIILKAEEMREQDQSVGATLMDFRKRLMKEHIHRATSQLLSLTKQSDEDAQQATLQSKIRELGRLGLMLPTLDDTSAIGALKRKIEELISPYDNLPARE
jgi:DNA primase